MFSFIHKKQKETPVAKKSIYAYILESLDQNGVLPFGFALPDPQEEDQLKFAPGAMDGIGIYHMVGQDMSQTVETFIPILVSALSSPDEQTQQALKDFLKENRVLRLIDPLSDQLRAGQTGIVPKTILEAAYQWAAESDDVELTKLGLALLGLFNIENNQQCRKVILVLGKCDEFTLYSLVAVSGWEDGRALIFDFAKTAHGWGKIHAVERFDPETSEEKDWILKSGCSNGVLNAYLGMTCAEKGNMIDTLRQEVLDASMLSGIGVIIEALLDEGPVAGISVYEHAIEAITLYLKHVEKHSENFGDSTEAADVILKIKSHYEKIGQGDGQKEALEICTQCDQIIAILSQ